MRSQWGSGGCTRQEVDRHCREISAEIRRTSTPFTEWTGAGRGRTRVGREPRYPPRRNGSEPPWAATTTSLTHGVSGKRQVATVGLLALHRSNPTHPTTSGSTT